MSRPGRYHRLSIAAKQAAERDSMREPSVVCPRCGTHTGVGDLLGHVERCQGQTAPHPRSRWVTWSQALELGVRPTTLSFWARTGAVRARGERLDRKYLYRDLVLRLVDQRASASQPRKCNPLQFRRKGWFSR